MAGTREGYPSHENPDRGGSAQVQRVHNRLWDAQETAKETATPGAALVLASDRDRAAAAAKAADPKATRYKKTHRWTSASEAGAQAGNKVNLGGTHIGGNTTRALA